MNRLRKHIELSAAILVASQCAFCWQASAMEPPLPGGPRAWMEEFKKRSRAKEAKKHNVRMRNKVRRNIIIARKLAAIARKQAEMKKIRAEEKAQVDGKKAEMDKIRAEEQAKALQLFLRMRPVVKFDKFDEAAARKQLRPPRKACVTLSQFAT